MTQQQPNGVMADASDSRTLVIRAMTRLREWHAKYGEHQPQWLPPAGDVRWLEDAQAYLDGVGVGRGQTFSQQAPSEPTPAPLEAPSQSDSVHLTGAVPSEAAKAAPSEAMDVLRELVGAQDAVAAYRLTDGMEAYSRIRDHHAAAWARARALLAHPAAISAQPAGETE